MITEIFYHTDNFCKIFESETEKNFLTDGKNKRKRSYNLSLSEIMTISIYYHYSGYNTFKAYYLKYVKNDLKKCFKNLVSYNRFLELKKKISLPLALFAKLLNSGKCTGVSFVYSFPLPVCHKKRSSSNKTFKNIAKKGKTSMGWFFGFKVHMIINHKGEIISFCITQGNIHDSNAEVIKKLTKKVKGKLFGDKGYLGKKLFEKLWNKGIKVVTKIKKNMKNKLMEMEDKILLRKRGIVESVINILKRILLIDHTRHRSSANFFSNLFSGLISYAFRKKKPSLKVCRNGLID